MKIFYLKIRKQVSSIISSLRVRRLRLLGVSIGDGCIIEGGVTFDKLYPELICIGSHTLIARGVKIFSHDHCKRFTSEIPMSAKVQIGSNSFVAADTIILPGVTLGDNIIIGAGSVVTKSFSGNCIVAGNPARIIKNDVQIGGLGILEDYFIK